MKNAGYFGTCKLHTLFGGRERLGFLSILWENSNATNITLRVAFDKDKKGQKNMEVVPVTQTIQSFFHRFKDKEISLQKFKIEHDRTALSGFLRNFGSYEQLAFQFRAASANYFNVFSIMRLGRYEEKLHTPFLAHFLDPSGAHSQGRLFFDAFFSEVLGIGKKLSSISQIEVLPECHTPYGRIDILVKYREAGMLRAVVIENKVYAGDQKEQLERYERHLTQTLNLKQGEYWLFYLSRWGEQPTEYSISKENYERLKSANLLFEISHRYNISNFLDACLPAIKAPVVAETVRQYLQTIQNL